MKSRSDNSYYRMKNSMLTLFLSLGILMCSFAQTLEKDWKFDSITSGNNSRFYQVAPSDTLSFKNGSFTFQLASKDLKSAGEYVFQNKLLILYFSKPKDSIALLRINDLTEETLRAQDGDIIYHLSPSQVDPISPVEKTTAFKFAEIRPSEGFSFTSLWRGALGMVTLIFIAFLFSSNRKAINWKTVGIGLSLQLIIAVGVLKISIIKVLFESIGKIFIKVLDFTKAGSQFLFEGLVVDMETFGFIFAFQVLPTILFFLH